MYGAAILFPGHPYIESATALSNTKIHVFNSSKFVGLFATTKTACMLKIKLLAQVSKFWVCSIWNYAQYV